jgi:predicted nucleic acid-binding protein
MVKYYVDTCIWLNLFKKEERFGVKYWEIVEEFVEKNHDLIISPAVLGELREHLRMKYEDIIAFFKENNVQLELIQIKDYATAKAIQEEQESMLSFKDCVHITIARRIGAVLITRDRELIMRGNEYVQTFRPEEINKQAY